MAVTTNTYTASSGWSRGDVVNLLESGFAFAELHGAPLSGIGTALKAFSGGGSVGAAYTYYYDVPTTSSGSGVNATVNVRRSNGPVVDVKLNKVGYNYADNEVLTIDAAHIGGTSNGAVAIGCTLNVMGGGSPTSYGSTTTFFRKETNSSYDTNRPYGMLRQVRNQSKKYGTTYRGFKVRTDNQLIVSVGPSYAVNQDDQIGIGMYGDSLRGMPYFDVTGIYGDRMNYDFSAYGQITSSSNFNYASDSNPTSHDLKLNVYRSAIDPTFSVFSFEQPGIDGSMTDSTFSTFIVHNFDSSLWDYDEVWTAGITFVSVSDIQNTNNATYAGGLNLNMCIAGNASSYGENFSATRAAECGYGQFYYENHYGNRFVTTRFVPTGSDYINSSQARVDATAAYDGYSDSRIFTRRGGRKDKGYSNDDSSDPNRYSNYDPITQTKSVIKGIPINPALVPCPYFMPDDFVIIEMTLDASEQNVRQGDTITISGSEVYTVITASYNKYSQTSGLFFCARKV